MANPPEPERDVFVPINQSPAAPLVIFDGLNPIEASRPEGPTISACPQSVLPLIVSNEPPLDVPMPTAPAKLLLPPKALLSASKGTPLTLTVGVCPLPTAMPVPALRPSNPVLLSVTLPLDPPPLNPVPAVTPVIVPVPGKVWPETNVTTPLLLTSNAVS